MSIVSIYVANLFTTHSKIIKYDREFISYCIPLEQVDDMMTSYAAKVQLPYPNGYCFSWYKNNKLHRENGPAVSNLTFESWYQNGKHHRLDGPAITSSNGSVEWRINGKLHREDGPAVIYGPNDYYKYGWYLNGVRHREDGPAVEYAHGGGAFYLNGEYVRSV